MHLHFYFKIRTRSLLNHKPNKTKTALFNVSCLITFNYKLNYMNHILKILRIKSQILCITEYYRWSCNMSIIKSCQTLFSFLFYILPNTLLPLKPKLHAWLLSSRLVISQKLALTSAVKPTENTLEMLLFKLFIISTQSGVCSRAASRILISGQWESLYLLTHDIPKNIYAVIIYISN